MKIVVCLCLIGLVFFSCKESKSEALVSDNEAFIYEMYEPSEMAQLMNNMYLHNEKIKQKILKGEHPHQFPTEFLKIHTAQFTKGKSRNDNFERFSKLFIETNRQIYDPNSPVALKDRFNNAVNLCISCHQTECTGPIPRIKKLLIR